MKKELMKKKKGCLSSNPKGTFQDDNERPQGTIILENF